MTDTDDRRPFPIQQGGTVPWWLAEVAYDRYSSFYGDSQPLDRLAERGGFGRVELLDFLRGGDGRGERAKDIKND